MRMFFEVYEKNGVFFKDGLLIMLYLKSAVMVTLCQQ